jgi:hyperosmotically inducible periplasmic protein
MNRRKSSSFAIAVLGAALVLPGSVIYAQTAPDNTKVNKEDQNASAPNADKAKNNTSDRELMAHIRRDIVKDKSLSTYAHNVKIISAHGKVTLRGPVNTDQEKQTIEQYAKKYAGDQNVTDELTVKGDAK